MKKMITIIIIIGLYSNQIIGSEKNKEEDHSHEKHSHEKESDEKHDDEKHDDEKHDDEEHDDEEHDHDDHKNEGHADHQEVSKNVGKNKGIIVASKDKGIKISPEAFKNFEIKTIKIISSGPWELAAQAEITSGEEKNLYRLRDEMFKRINFNKISEKKNGKNKMILISSSEISIGDEIVISGGGFLKIAEVAAFGGAEDGHSH